MKKYAFSTAKNQHHFSNISDRCFIRMREMEDGDIPWDSAEYERLEAVRERAEYFFLLPLPVAFLPWEELAEARKLLEKKERA